jgi:hypothetical protein
MRKVIAILMALCILTVFVSAASACGKPGEPKCPPVVKPATIKNINTPTLSNAYLVPTSGWAQGTTLTSATASGIDCAQTVTSEYAQPTDGGGMIAHAEATATGDGAAPETASSAGSTTATVAYGGYVLPA